MPSDPYGSGRDQDADLDFDAYYEAERQEAEDNFASQDRAVRDGDLEDPYMAPSSPSAAEYDDTVYDETELNRAFDAAGVSFDDGLDPDEFSDDDDEADEGEGGKLWKALLLVAMIGGFGGFIYYMYTSEFMEGGDNTVPLVLAEEGADKVKPEGPTGEQVPHQGVGVLNQSGANAQPTPVTVLPPPPAPVAPSTAQSAEQVLQSADDFRQRVEQVMGSVAPNEQGTAAANPGQVPSVPAANPAPAIVAPQTSPLQQRSAPMTAPVPAPAQPLPRQAPPTPPSILGSPSSVSGAVRPPMPSDFPQTRQAEAQIAAPRAPSPQMMAEPSQASRNAPVAPAPAAAPPERAPAPQQARAPAAQTIPPAGGGFRVQLASMRSTGAAETQWRRLQGQNGDLLGGLSPDIQRADLGTRGIYYRLRVGPLATRQQATSLCGQ